MITDADDWAVAWVYVLKSPGGHLVPETVAYTDGEAWQKAFCFISHTDPEFERRYWKEWAKSRRAARRRGWRIVKATLTDHKVHKAYVRQLNAD